MESEGEAVGPSVPGVHVLADAARVSVPRAEVEALFADPRGHILAVSPLAMFAVDADEVLRFTSGGWLQRAGLSPADRIGRPLTAIWGDRPEILEQVRRALEHCRAQRFDVAVNGRVLDTVLHPVHAADEPGRPCVGVLGFSVDVTADRDAARRAETVARLIRRAVEARDDVRELVSALADEVAIDTGAVAGVRLELPDGGLAAAAGGDPGRQEALAALLAGAHADVRDAAPSDHPGPLRVPPQRAGGTGGTLVWPIRTAAGLLGVLGVRPGEGWRAAVATDPHDHLFLSDVAARVGLRVEAALHRQAERRQAVERESAARELAQTQARLRMAFDDAPVGMVLGSLDPADPGRVLLANHAMAQLTGFARHELVGRSFRDLTHPDDRGFDAAVLREIAAGDRQVYGREKRLLRADGTPVWVRTSVSVLEEPGRAASVLLHVQDISRQKAAEEASRTSIATVQAALLPAEITAPDGIEVAAGYRSAGVHDRIGGDWYDTIVLPGGRLALVIGDVEGHDLVAASVMGLVRGAVRSSALDGHSPSTVVQRVNAFLLSTGIERLVTLAYVELRAGHRLATVAVAGHPLPLVVPPGGPAASPALRPGLALGVDPRARWDECTVLLPQAATVVLYTDGLVDFPRAPADQQARVTDLVGRHAGAPVGELADRLVAAAPGYDDLAVLVARAEPAARRAAHRDFASHPISAGLARTWIADLFTVWDDGGALPAGSPAADLQETARLLVTELVSNAVRHTEENVQVRADVVDGTLRVEVVDSSDRMPVLRAAGTDEVEGRGLRVVEALATGWGVELDAHGKIVWFELDLRGPADPDPDALLAAFDDERRGRNSGSGAGRPGPELRPTRVDAS